VFKEISQMQRPKPETPRRIAERLAQMIGEEHGGDYAEMPDSTHMVDLSPDVLNATSDPVRRQFQRFFVHNDDEDDPKRPLLGIYLHGPQPPPPLADDG
jgi:hypothetical protein